jgi:hypothetical protein
MSISEERQGEVAVTSDPQHTGVSYYDSPTSDILPIGYRSDGVRVDADWTGQTASLGPPRSAGTQEPSTLPSTYAQNSSIIAPFLSSLFGKLEEIAQALDNIQHSLASLEGIYHVFEEAQAQELSPAEETSEVSKEKVKQMVAKLFEEKGQLDYVEIMTTLNLDLKLVVDICAELEKNGRIEGVD